MTRLATAKKGSDSRHTAEERRAEVLKAAVAEFALHGLHGTSTEMIARRIGISQPYIFRLFPPQKRALPGRHRPVLRSGRDGLQERGRGVRDRPRIRRPRRGVTG